MTPPNDIAIYFRKDGSYHVRVVADMSKEDEMKAKIDLAAKLLSDVMAQNIKDAIEAQRPGPSTTNRLPKT